VSEPHPRRRRSRSGRGRGQQSEEQDAGGVRPDDDRVEPAAGLRGEGVDPARRIVRASAELERPALERGAGITLAELRVDGGAAANDLLLQLQADLLARPVVRPVVTETTALGAAWLAGLATGVWRDEAELAQLWRAERRFEPRMRVADAELLKQRWQEAVNRSRGWIPA